MNLLNDFDKISSSSAVIIYKHKTMPLELRVDVYATSAGFAASEYYWKYRDRWMNELYGMSANEVSEEYLNLIILKYSKI
jgi:hypothetical protein